MTRSHRTGRFLIGLGLTLLCLIAGLYFANRSIPTWGSTPTEQVQALPGDDLFSQPVLKWENAITIHAAPQQIWPWLIQMGDTRAGYYSYRSIEKAITALAGVDVASYYPNTNAIHPEWQSPEIGQGMLMDVLVLRDYKANQYLVAGPKPGQEQAGLLWTWALAPQADGTTRLLVHMRIQIPGMGENKLVEAAMNLATFMMERRMMEGIRLHAEGGSEAGWVQIAEALVWLAVLALGLVAASRSMNWNAWRLPLAVGLACVIALIVLTYLQPALWLRGIIVLLLAGALFLKPKVSAQPIKLGSSVDA